jgi:hypothetical protein
MGASAAVGLGTATAYARFERHHGICRYAGGVVTSEASNTSIERYCTLVRTTTAIAHKTVRIEKLVTAISARQVQVGVGER